MKWAQKSTSSVKKNIFSLLIKWPLASSYNLCKKRLSWGFLSTFFNVPSCKILWCEGNTVHIVHVCGASINRPVPGSLWTPGCPEHELTFRLFFSYSRPLSPCPPPAISISPPLSPARFIIDGCPGPGVFIHVSEQLCRMHFEVCMCVCVCLGQFLHICRLHFSQSGRGKGCFSPPGEGVSHLERSIWSHFLPFRAS